MNLRLCKSITNYTDVTWFSSNNREEKRKNSTEINLEVRHPGKVRGGGGGGGGGEGAGGGLGWEVIRSQSQ